MLRKIYLALVVVVASYLSTHAQSGTLKGKVLDGTTNEPLPFANVIVELNGSQSGGSQTDFDGNYTIKPLTPGKYDIKVSYVGYSSAKITGVLVSSDKITFYDIKMAKASVNINEVKIEAYKVPIVDKGNPSTQNTITQEEIKAAPTRNVNSIVSTSAGVYQKDEGGDLNVRGSRSDATEYYIDGIKVRGSLGLPQSGIEQVTVVTGGVPAQYGDATGGIINITTRGPSRDFNGGVELVTSELFDKYGYNLVGLNLSGPIAQRTNSDGSKSPMLGFFISGELESQKVPSPSAIGFYQVKGSKLDSLRKFPFSANPNGNGVVKNAEYVTNNDLEKISYYNNVATQNYRLSGKLDFQPSKNLTVTFGGSWAYNKGHNFTYEYQLFNYDNNSTTTGNTWRVFGRVTHKLGNPEANKEKSASAIQNAYYTIQADYEKVHSTNEDEDHGDRLFDYGYLGKYTTYRQNQYFRYPQAQIGDFNHDGIQDSINYFNLWVDTLVQYEAGGLNQTTENYTLQWYDLAPGKEGYYENLSDIRGGGVVGGLLNGDRPSNVYSMWYNSGRVANGYSFSNNSQVRVSASGSADIKNHAIQVGFEYEQRKDAYWASLPIGLWGSMRQLQNQRIQNYDTQNGEVIGDSLNSPYLYSPTSNSFTTGDTSDFNVGFFELVRQKLGVDNTTYIDLDAYDYLNKKDFFTLDLFAPDELLNAGLVGYAGYDYTGKHRTDKATFQDYFSKADANGNATREIAPFQPIYMAGYIQDKFAINDLIFNVGVRVDRFDANQKALKDPYSLYQTKTAGEVEIPDRPANIGDGYVVYVADATDPGNSEVIGYRNGDIWYDANGGVVTDPGVLAKLTTTGQIAPYLVNPTDDIQSSTFDVNTSFKDYEPQITVMPRIAFSFPISDQALFFAHYDILTQRPTDNIQTLPGQYYNFGAGTLNNSNLKPTKTIDYELGFKQSLSRSSAISISAFYREMRDMIQLMKVNYAYPVSYTTYGNRDFGTVKGLSLSYDLRRTGNVRLSASYTLQFADGTGSGSASSSELISSGQPNLLSVFPLDYDQRHTLVASFDFRYGSGSDYNGPMWFGSQFFSNAGLNMILRAGSGTPYSATTNITTQANNIGLQQAGTTAMKGSVNGSRLPWQFRIDLKIDKDFALKAGKDGKHDLALNVYLQIQNVLNTENVLSVYRATGSPSDDGYLAYSGAQTIINSSTSVQSFTDLYNVKVNNPANYSLPRRARLGIELQF
ncbi:MAG: TonB-dependent receptor [Bacteroidia bacterium]